MAEEPEHAKFMRVALAEARKGLGHTSPNPAVGAILVSRGKVVARGFHHAAGEPHAEIECLRNYGNPITAEHVLYVTLEPCSTTNRTPPCVDAILAAGVRHVVVGAIDPNPAHAGRGLELLRNAGVTVQSGVMAEECARLNEAFNKWIVAGIPFVIAKCGLSLDGRLTRPPGETRWLTGAAARRDAHALRANVDAILIGAETLRQDNPRLTVRGLAGARQPRRVVLTRSGELPREAHLFTDKFAAQTLVYRQRALPDVLTELGRQQITSVLIEGGGEVLGEAFDARLVDKVQFYLAPLLTGGSVPAVAGRGAPLASGAGWLQRTEFERFGPDIRVTGYPVWSTPTADE